MSRTRAATAKMPVDEYLELDESFEPHCEYRDGELFPVDWGSFVHGRIGASLAMCMGGRLDGRPCVLACSVRVCVNPTNYLYADLVVVTDKVEFSHSSYENLTNPKLVLEVFATDTAGYHYGRKFSLYAEIPTLEEYVLIAQDELRVDVFRKSGTQWILARYSGRDSVAKLDSLGIELPLAEVYAGLDDSYFEHPAP